jgi:hypothetical protein
VAKLVSLILARSETKLRLVFFIMGNEFNILSDSLEFAPCLQAHLDYKVHYGLSRRLQTSGHIAVSHDLEQKSKAHDIQEVQNVFRKKPYSH